MTDDVQRVMNELLCAICRKPISPSEADARKYLARAEANGMDVDQMLASWGGACESCRMRSTVEEM